MVFRDVAVVDSHGIFTKCKIASRGYIKGRVASGIKVHLLTIDGVPFNVMFSTASEHDILFLEDLIGLCDGVSHVVVGRAYIDFELIADFARRGISFTTRAKSNLNMSEINRFGDDGYLVVERLKVVDGVGIRRFEVFDEYGNKVFDVLTTLDDWRLTVALYDVRWYIKKIFQHLTGLGFRPFGYSYGAFVASVLVYLIAILVFWLYGILARRGKSITKLRDKVKRWFMSIFKPPRKPPN